MVDVLQILTQFASDNGHQLLDRGNGEFVFQFNARLKDGTKRTQIVWIWIIQGRAFGKDCLFFSSRVGTFTPTVDLYSITKDTGKAIYSNLTIVHDTDSDGNPCESLVVQASPILEYLNADELTLILREVGQLADYIEGNYFHKDTY